MAKLFRVDEMDVDLVKRPHLSYPFLPLHLCSISIVFHVDHQMRKHGMAILGKEDMNDAVLPDQLAQ